MYRMVANIVFPDSRGVVGAIRHPGTVRIESSWKELTDRAEITMPRNCRWFKTRNVKEIFRPGDRVVIQLGYKGLLATEFTGYITQVSADIPVRIKCEDEMWKLRQIPVNYSNRGVTLQRMLRDICPGYEIDALEGVNLGSVKYAATNVAEVLSELSKGENYNLYSYFKDGKLYCGKYYAQDSGREPVPFDLERIPSNDLSYRDPGYRFVKVIGRGATIRGKKLEYSFGETGGDTIQVEYSKAQVMGELMRRVKEDYDRAKREGFTGNITAFGHPRVEHGWKAAINSFVYPDRNGIYYIDYVTRTWGPDGYRQQITLGERAR